VPDRQQAESPAAEPPVGASLVAATLAGWPLAERLRFANLAAALSVQRIGGAAAPGWPGIAHWWRGIRSAPHHDLRRDYAFLDRVIPRATSAKTGVEG
jgi:hypothetical protein